MRPFPLVPALILVATIGATIAQADVENNLVFRRQNGEPIQFAATARAFAWCGPYEEGNGVEVFVGDPPNEASSLS